MDDDRALYLRWLATRDEAAFGALARRHADLVVDIAWRASGDLAAAEDALQEALLALARDGTDRPAQVGVRAWLARSAIPAARHGKASERARARRERAVGSARGEAAMETTGDESAAAVREALARLPGDDATAIALRHLHGMEYAEIAAILDVEEPTARVRVHRAIERLRAEARRGDLDDARLVPLFLAAPRAAATAARVESAIAAALSATAIPVSGAVPAASVAVVAGAAVGSAALWWGIAALAAAGVVAAGIAFLPASGSSSSEPARRSVGRADAPAGVPGLARRPADPAAARSAEDSDDASAGPPAPAPRRGGGALAKDTRVTVRLRMDLVRPGREPREIAVTQFVFEGRRFQIDRTREEGKTIHLKPGGWVVLTTDDAEAAFPIVGARVPDPVPGEWIVRVPAADDPRLRSLVLQVVDVSGTPVPDAVADWDGAPVPEPSQGADASGRIRVEMPAAIEGVRALLAAVFGQRLCVHAPGFLPPGGFHIPGVRTIVRDEVDLAVVDSWLDRGVWRVVLEEASPAVEGEEPLVERAVRFVNADGTRVRGAYVAIHRPFDAEAVKVIRQLGAAVTPREAQAQGFRRSDADGVIRFPMRDLVALEMRVDDLPFAAWGLSAAEWPATGPREVRVPDRSDLEATILGLPGGTDRSWGRDRLGLARTPSDGPSDGQHLILDAGATKAAAEGSEFPAWFYDVSDRPLFEDDPVVRIPLAVGAPTRLFVSAGGQTRVLDVKPETRGVLRIERRWEDLPLAPKPRGETEEEWDAAAGK